MIIGIDNGLDGGLCALSQPHGLIIDKMAMPTFERSGKREIDTKAIHTWIRNLNTEPLIAIEEPLKHAKSSQAMRSMGISYGKILGMCESHDWTVLPIQVKDWQKAMLGKKLTSGSTKSAALQKAGQLWPDECWLQSARCRTPHDGMVDAALIAAYCVGTKQHGQARHY